MSFKTVQLKPLFCSKLKTFFMVVFESRTLLMGPSPIYVTEISDSVTYFNNITFKGTKFKVGWGLVYTNFSFFLITTYNTFFITLSVVSLNVIALLVTVHMRGLFLAVTKPKHQSK